MDETIGNRTGVSRDTVRKVEKIIDNVSDESLDLIRSGKLSINEAYEQLLDQEMAVELEQQTKEKKQEMYKSIHHLDHKWKSRQIKKGDYEELIEDARTLCRREDDALIASCAELFYTSKKVGEIDLEIADCILKSLNGRGLSPNRIKNIIFSASNHNEAIKNSGLIQDQLESMRLQEEVSEEERLEDKGIGPDDIQRRRTPK